PGPRLAALLETWRAQKEEGVPGFPWVRALRPPAVHLGTALRAVLRGHEGGGQEQAWVFGVAWSPDGLRIISGGYDRTVRGWDHPTGQEVACLRGHGGEYHAGAVYGLAYAPDGRTFVSGGGDTTVRVWDAEGGQERACLRGHAD